MQVHLREWTPLACRKSESYGCEGRNSDARVTLRRYSDDQLMPTQAFIDLLNRHGFRGVCTFEHRALPDEMNGADARRAPTDFEPSIRSDDSRQPDPDYGLLTATILTGFL